MAPLLEELRIVYGFGFRGTPGEKRLTIVLECQPFPGAPQRIEDRLMEVVNDISARRRRTGVTPEPPHPSKPTHKGRRS